MRRGDSRAIFRRLPEQAPNDVITAEQATIPEDAEVVVVGSGFGGGVAALRLAEAGVPVTLIEKGRKWDIVPALDEPFCRMFGPDGRAAWLSDETVVPLGPAFPVKRYIGVLERIRSPNLDVICGSAYGGGSVVTGMLSLVPLQHLFERVFPPEVSYAEMASIYYPRAQTMLRSSTIPDDVLATDNYTAMRVFMRQVQKAGLGIKMIPTATDWDVMRKELAGEIFRSGVDGELIFGNNSGWKNSVDRTYLRAAEATGRLTVLLQHRVMDIGRRPDGRYVLHVDAIDEQGRVVRKVTIICRALVVSAGSFWTTSLFVRARAKGTLPELSSHVGEGFGNNGNCMYMREGVGEDTGPMVMGKATDFHGRVKGYPRLYALDGSLIPGSTAAVNPSLTITANAERCIEAILTEDGLDR